jgi:hypothetical protein
MAYCASPRWLWWWRNWWNDWQGKLKYSEKTCPSATLSTTNPTCCPDANPGRRSGKSATNRLSYGTALGHISKYCFVSSWPTGLFLNVEDEWVQSWFIFRLSKDTSYPDLVFFNSFHGIFRSLQAVTSNQAMNICFQILSNSLYAFLSACHSTVQAELLRVSFSKL